MSSGRGADREWRSGHNFNFLVITFSLRRPSLSDGGVSVDKPAGAAHLVGEGGSGFVAWKRVLAFDACVFVDAVAPTVIETWSELYRVVGGFACWIEGGVRTASQSGALGALLVATVGMLAGLVNELLEFRNLCLEFGNFGVVFGAVGAVVSCGRGCSGEEAVVVRCHKICVEEGKGLG